MAISPIFNAFRQTAEESGGQPSYMDALLKSFKGAQEAAETVNKPKQLAETLLAAKLKNAHDKTINQYLEPSEQARIGLQEGNIGLLPSRKALLQAQMQEALRKSSQPILSPYEKAETAARAKENVKTIAGGEEQIPEAEGLLQKLHAALPIIKKHPEWFGPGIGGYDIHGPSYRARNIHDPEFGKIQALLGQLVGPQAQQLSGNKVLATALNLAQDIKPSFGENFEPAYGKIEQITNEAEKRLNEHKKRYKEAGGKREFGSKLDPFTEEDIKSTAKQTGLTIAEVKRRLKEAGHL